MKTIRIGLITTIALLLDGRLRLRRLLRTRTPQTTGSARSTDAAVASHITGRRTLFPLHPLPQQEQAATSVPPTQPPAANGDAQCHPSLSPLPSRRHPPTPSIVTPATGNEKTVPEISGIASWINSEPITFEEQRGKVVLVDFWTYTCVNCIRTLPYLKAWHEKYADKGLVIVGVHTPEFDFEKDRDNVIEATEGFGLEWPIAQDNDFKTWRAFNNRYWPASTSWTRTASSATPTSARAHTKRPNSGFAACSKRRALTSATCPPGPFPSRNMTTMYEATDRETGLTREIYAGFERNYSALLSSAPYVLHQEYYEEEDAEIFYTDPGEYRNHFLYLQGLWRNDAERLVHARETENYEDYLALKFNATSVNAVMSPVNGGEYQVRVLLNDMPISPEAAGTDVMFDADGNGYITVDSARMYHIVNLPKYESHELKLSSNSPEFSLFAYTFGAYDGGEPAPTGYDTN